MSDDDTRSRPAPADAVRVWRGFRAAGLAKPDFLSSLGRIFIPVTVQMQSGFGLNAYLPSILPQDKPDLIPDEIALVFYATQQHYRDATNCVGGRAYSRLHDTVFSNQTSRSGFPRLLGTTLAPDMPYHLFSDPADWQSGVCKVFVGMRRTATDWRDQMKSMLAWLDVQRTREGRPDGAVVAASHDYVVYWEHWASAAEAASSQIAALDDLYERVMSNEAQPVAMNSTLWTPSDGIAVKFDASYNLGFERRP